MNEPLRIGVIGVGAMGSAHARHLQEGLVQKATLAAICDSDSLRLAAMEAQFPGVPAFGSAEQLLSSETCDAVIIATPHYAHPVIGIRAFEKGLHVLTEKPVAVQLSAARALIEAADKSGKTFAVMFNQRTDPLFRAARQLLQSGNLGTPQRLHWAVTNWYRTQHYYNSGGWRATWDGEGGGVLMNQAPHNLDIWQWLFGMPTRLRAFCTAGKYHQIEVEDEATVYAEYSSGATAVFQTTTGEYPGTNRLEIVGDLGKLVLEEGKLRFWRLAESARTVSAQSGEGFAKIPMQYSEQTFPRVKNPHGQVLQNFVDHILSGVPLIADGREGLGALTLANAAYLSAWTDSWVPLPMDEAAFDRELEKRRSGSSPRTAAPSSEASSYQERWQVRW